MYKISLVFWRMGELCILLSIFTDLKVNEDITASGRPGNHSLRSKIAFRAAVRFSNPGGLAVMRWA